MELFFNELSIDGQFPDLSSFQRAIGRLMTMRNQARRHGRELYCHGNILQAKVTGDQVLPRAVQVMKPNERRAFMQWLTKTGPFWERERIHDSDDFLECQERIVTDTAIGEAAFRRFRGLDYQLVSLIPSSWNDSSLKVWWRQTGEDDRSVSIPNHTTHQQLSSALESSSEAIDSWIRLETHCRRRFPSLTISGSAFDHLDGQPFVKSASERIIVLLDVLEKLKNANDASGNRTAEGHHLYQNYFTGEKARFSDSSDGEKRDFNKEMTFPHPEKPGQSIKCTWHGKIKTPQYRIHFSQPISAHTPLYVVYVGPKITKR